MIDRRRAIAVTCSLASSLTIIGVAGCEADLAGSASQSPAIDSELVNEVVGNDPIAEAGTLVEAKEALTMAPPGLEPESIQFRGRIGGTDLPAFANDEATFLVTEIVEDPNAEDGHDASTCPFCKRAIENAPKGAVTIVDGKGEPIAASAESVFGLSEGDIVQVSGSAEYIEGINTIRIRADRLYVER